MQVRDDIWLTSPAPSVPLRGDTSPKWESASHLGEEGQPGTDGAGSDMGASSAFVLSGGSSRASVLLVRIEIRSRRTDFIGKRIGVMGNKTKPDIVIEVIRHVPIAIRTADIPMIVVPGAAAIHQSPTTGCL